MLPVPPASPLQADRKDNVKIVCLLNNEGFPHGDDALAKELEACCDEATVRHLLLDFAKVQWITSTELGMLILLHKQMKAHGGRLTLFNLREEIYEVFTVTRLHTLLEIDPKR